MEIFKELTKKGYKHYYDGTVEELDDINRNNPDLHSEIMQVIMWLYETHEIWISVDRHFDKFISKNNGVLITFYGNRKSYFDTPTEAYEAAIEYCLTKIKLK